MLATTHVFRESGQELGITNNAGQLSFYVVPIVIISNLFVLKIQAAILTSIDQSESLVSPAGSGYREVASISTISKTDPVDVQY